MYKCNVCNKSFKGHIKVCIYFVISMSISLSVSLSLFLSLFDKIIVNIKFILRRRHNIHTSFLI